MSDTTPQFELPADIPDNFTKRIGQIAADWGALEFQINEMIWNLAAVFPVLGACITAQIYNVNGRLDALIALLRARQASEELISRVHKFQEKVREASERRNRIIHDAWTVVGAETFRLEVTARGKLNFDLVKIMDTDLAKNQADIRMWVDRFGEICNQILDALPTLPGIPRGQLEPLTRVRENRIQNQTTGTK
jgi:hypothetical protein